MSSNEFKINSPLASTQEPDKAQFVPSPKACRIIMGHIRSKLAGEFRYEDIWAFIEDMIRSEAITGLIDGRPINPNSLANKENYTALRHGDDLRLPVIARHAPSMGHLGREIETYCDGPVYFDLGELQSALAKSRPEFVDDGEFADENTEIPGADEASTGVRTRAGIGGPNKISYRVAIAMASYHISKNPNADFEVIFEKVKVFWANTNEKSSVDTAYLKYLLKPVFYISRAEFEDVRYPEIEKMAGVYVAEDLKRHEDRRVVNGRAKAPRDKRQGESDQHE